MDTILSPDLRNQLPHGNFKVKPVRSHVETMVHPILKWIKKEVRVIDAIEITGIVVTQMGRSWEIPFTKEEERKETDDE
jgi:hypothetical protein